MMKNLYSCVLYYMHGLKTGTRCSFMQVVVAHIQGSQLCPALLATPLLATPLQKLEKKRKNAKCLCHHFLGIKDVRQLKKEQFTMLGMLLCYQENG